MREEWGRLTGEFDLDHFQPRSKHPDLETVYENLVYACHTCNQRKSNKEMFDPEACLTRESVRVHPDGRLEGLTPEAKSIISKLLLDSPKLRKWRLIWIRNVDLAKRYDAEQLIRMLGFPDDMPNLATLAPPANSKPEGVEQSYYALRSRGELPEYYVE